MAEEIRTLIRVEVAPGEVRISYDLSMATNRSTDTLARARTLLTDRNTAATVEGRLADYPVLARATLYA